MLKILDEACGHVLDGDVGLAQLQAHELFEVGHAPLPASEGGLADVTALAFFLALDVGLAENVAQHLWLLDQSEIMVL
ncbi:hypothetical protein IMSAGC006_01862 [Muribaculaceae bacterium]|nr:hypothetical protein IMSAGC006_01862 [Muribaculaceae bacterium]